MGRRGFKPCYKWITFNTKDVEILLLNQALSFKPCYKWITFNTKKQAFYDLMEILVLNLVINGLPSILLLLLASLLDYHCFKPCYKWITFNTSKTQN